MLSAGPFCLRRFFTGPAARGRALAAAGEGRAPYPAAAVGTEGTVAGGTPAGRRGHRAVLHGAVRPAGAAKNVAAAEGKGIANVACR